MTLSTIFTLVSLQFGIPDGLLSAMCEQESLHKPETIVPRDGKGGRTSYGICQLQMRTARQMGFKGKPKELLNPEINIELAGRYLRSHYDKYGSWAKAVTAYNKGHSTSHGGSKYLADVFNRMMERNEHVSCSLDDNGGECRKPQTQGRSDRHRLGSIRQ